MRIAWKWEKLWKRVRDSPHPLKHLPITMIRKSFPDSHLGIRFSAELSICSFFIELGLGKRPLRPTETSSEPDAVLEFRAFYGPVSAIDLLKNVPNRSKSYGMSSKCFQKRSKLRNRAQKSSRALTGRVHNLRATSCPRKNKSSPDIDLTEVQRRCMLDSL